MVVINKKQISNIIENNLSPMKKHAASFHILTEVVITHSHTIRVNDYCIIILKTAKITFSSWKTEYLP